MCHQMMTIPIYWRMVSIQGILQYTRSCGVTLLAELIDLLSKDYELNIIDSANNSVLYIRVPKTSSDRSFQNSKEGSVLPSKSPGQNTEAPTKPHTASPTAYSTSTKTQFLPPARLKDYLCQNQCLQHNSLQWWMHQELVARANNIQQSTKSGAEETVASMATATAKTTTAAMTMTTTATATVTAHHSPKT